MQLSKFLSGKNYTAIPLTLNATHHFELKVVLNGVKSKFILDTGASNTCIDDRLMEHFQLIPRKTTIKASGAGASEMTARLASKVQIKIGKWTCKNNDVVLLDLSHVNNALQSVNLTPVEGIIGADVLQKGKAVIDYNKNMLYLKKNCKKNQSLLLTSIVSE